MDAARLVPRFTRFWNWPSPVPASATTIRAFVRQRLRHRAARASPSPALVRRILTILVSYPRGIKMVSREASLRAIFLINRLKVLQVSGRTTR